MNNNKFANLANYPERNTDEQKSKLLGKALDCLADVLGIEFGSLTVHFHKGKWSPRIEIQKKVIHKVDV